MHAAKIRGMNDMLLHTDGRNTGSASLSLLPLELIEGFTSLDLLGHFWCLHNLLKLGKTIDSLRSQDPMSPLLLSIQT